MKQSAIMKALIVIFCFVINANAYATEAEFFDVGPFKLRALVKPEIPKVGKNQITVWLQDSAGQPLTGAVLNVVAVMPAMGSMPAMYAPAEMSEDMGGRYEGEFEPAMGGEWPLMIEIEKGDEKGSITFNLATGRKGLQCATCNRDGMYVPGTVRVDTARRQLIGVTTAAVKQRKLRITTRAAGIVTYDETRLHDVSLKFDGWIGELYADALGKSVKKGKPLFTVYSPELLAAQEEYLETLRRVSNKAGHSKQRLAAAKRRLSLWDLSDVQIEALGRRGKAQEYVTILAATSGVVIDKQIVAGSAFRMGQQVLRLADLSQIWVEAQLYDYELPLIKLGMPAKVLLPELQGREYLGKVDFIYPYMESDTRTTRARITIDNSDGFLRPAMYAEVKLKAKLGKRLVVPESAVLYSGRSRVVFIDSGDGRLVPRKIKTGQRNRKWIEVLEGIEEGDIVVTSGNFLIAAESRLKAGIESW